MSFQSPLQRWMHNRWLLLLFLMGVYSLYFPLGLYASTLPNHDVQLPIDQATPLMPNWIYIYAMIYLIGFVPFAVVKQPRVFFAAMKAFLLIMGIAYLVFVSFPVVAFHRPDDFQVDSFATWGLRFCYFLDTQANCFPSLHVAVSFLAAFANLKVDRLVGWITFGLAILIAISTLLVKQHFFVDVVFGFVLAEVGRRAFLQSLRLRIDEKIDPMPGRKGALIILLVYSGFLLCLYMAYLSGWVPWG